MIEAKTAKANIEFVRLALQESLRPENELCAITQYHVTESLQCLKLLDAFVTEQERSVGK